MTMNLKERSRRVVNRGEDLTAVDFDGNLTLCVPRNHQTSDGTSEDVISELHDIRDAFVGLPLQEYEL
ncbi:hypothetical protein BHE74_00028392 [Ensete ventricosum]|nr:hypothetical protein BHE74_00028392 [Ensete ventricosum]RZS08175.1 hypothetical protein BHM03_00039112 [Ensete ventricosum]